MLRNDCAWGGSQCCHGFGSTLVYVWSGGTSTSIRTSVDEVSQDYPLWLMEASPISVIHAASDLSLFTTSTSQTGTTLTSRASPASTTAIATLTGTQPTITMEATAGISAGAKAGIGVGAALACVFAGVAILLYSCGEGGGD